MYKQLSQAIESLQIFSSSVKCQRCGIAVPVVGKLTRAKNDRIAILQRRIK
jgi:adenine-specific DNA methylase